MSHKVGALLLPAPIPTSLEDAPGDPGLLVFRDFFRAMLDKYVGALWARVAPHEPIVKNAETHNPEDCAFYTKDLPLLFIWRGDDTTPTRYTDDHKETASELHILWVAPPATQGRRAQRHPFFGAFQKVIALAEQHGRDPAYKHPDDVDANGVETAEASYWGSDVLRFAGVSNWERKSITRETVVIPIDGGRNQSHVGLMATFRISEVSTTDNEAFGAVPTIIQADLKEGGENPATRFTIRVPSP